jgi:hypothetical protein
MAGFAVGISFVMMFSIIMPPNLSPTDNQIIQASNMFPESQVFLSEYPDAKVRVEWTGDYDSTPMVVYSAEKTYDDGTLNESIMTVEMNSLTKMPSRSKMNIVCNITDIEDGHGSGYFTFGMSIEQVLRTTKCAK